MENKRLFVFEVDSDIVKEARNNPNYLIQYSDDAASREYCAIYFSSHNIYYPNSEPVFRRQIIEKDHYEWYSTRVQKAHKHIFVRDIFKQLYLMGINSDVNSPELLVELLQNETAGYKVIMVGSSGGASAAALFGSLLGAEKVIAFNPAFNYDVFLERFSEESFPLVFRLKDTPARKYYDLCRWMNDQTDIFYFYSYKSEQDIIQHRHLKNSENTGRVHVIGFSSFRHGIPFLKVCLPKIINMETEGLIALSRKTHNPLIFSVRIVGLKNAFGGLVKQLYYDFYKRRLTGD